MELRKIWEILFRRKWILIQAFLIILLTAVISSFLIPPNYEASAKLFIKTSDTASSLLESIGLSDLSDIIPMSGDDDDLKNHITLVTVAPLLNKLIAKLQLRNKDGDLLTPEKLLKSSLLAPAMSPEAYVEITEIEDTNLIEIKPRASSPEEVAMIANTLAEMYLEENLEQKRVEYRSARTFIEDQIKSAKAGFLDALEQIKNFKTKEKTIDLGIETKLAIEKMGKLMEQKEDNIIDIDGVKARIKTIKVQSGKQNEKYVSSSAIEENPQIEKLKKSLLDLEFKLAGTLVVKSPTHQDILVLKSKIKKANEELKKEMSLYRASSKDLQKSERELAVLEVHLLNVNADIEKYLALLITIPGKEFTVSQLKLNLSATQVLYSSMLDYLYQIGVAEAMTLSDIRLVEAATEPDINSPKSPNMVLNGILGAFMGLIFGLGLAFLVDYLDDTIKTPDDAKGFEDFALLGVIPRFKKKESVIISGRDPKDPICESYRTLRNSIKFSSLDRPINNLVVSSSLIGEGKTTTVINLAISITNEGKRVLIIDTDLRKPRIHNMLGISNSIGITNILAGEDKSLKDAIQKTDIAGLSILTTGPIPADPGRMVESNKMKELINNLTQQYDFVILDSPPILVANDAIVLSKYTDSLFIVLESQKVTHRALSQVQGLLKQANIKTIGATLNKVRQENNGYYYYYDYKSGNNKG